MNIENILESNNEGVKLLQSGCYNDAVQVFRGALRQMKKICQHFSSRPKCIFHLPLAVKTQVIANSFLEPNYIFQNALIIETERKSEQNSEGVSLHATEVIVYNLSLARHFSIIGRRVKLRAECREVLGLYEKALRALQINQISKEAIAIKKTPLRDVIFLGILNNIGVMNHECNCFGQAKLCFDILRGLINRTNLSILGEVAHQGMLINAWLLEEPKLAQAA